MNLDNQTQLDDKLLKLLKIKLISPKKFSIKRKFEGKRKVKSTLL